MSTTTLKSRDSLHSTKSSSHSTTTTPMTRLLKSVLLGALFVAGGAINAAAQQRPTPEGTAIENFATASYTDARGNQYAGVSSDTATITVGFKGAPAVSGASATPAPNSTNYIAFTLTNVGNGRDTLRIESDAVATGVTLTGNYRYNGTVYATRALLNAALTDALTGVQVDTAGGTNPSIIVEVEYDVGTGAGSIDLEAGSTRDLTSPVNERTATGTATINAPVLTYDVTVAAPADAAVQAGTSTYGEFTVTNGSNVPASFALSAGVVSDVAASIVDIRNTSGTVITSTTVLNPGSSMTVRVHYTVPAKILTPTPNNVVGEEVTISLTATGEGAASSASNSDDVVYTISEPVGTLEFVKVALTDAEVALQPTDRVLPGQFIKYRITITQPLTAVGDLASITVTDALSENLIYVSTTAETGTWAAASISGQVDEDAAGPSTRMVGGTVTIPFTGTLTPGSSASVIIRVQVR